MKDNASKKGSWKNYLLLLIAVFVGGGVIGRFLFVHSVTEEEHESKMTDLMSFGHRRVLSDGTMYIPPANQRRKIQHEMLSMMRKMDERDMQQVARIEEPTAEEFFKKYVVTGTPVVISGVVNKWKAFTTWSDEYLNSKIGNVKVAIEMSKTDRFYGDSGRKRMGDFFVRDFLKLYRKSASERYYLAETSILKNFAVLQQDIPEHPSFIDPNLFRLETLQLWIGPGGQITPMHSDDQENFLCQLEGSRKAILYDTLQTDLIYPEVSNEVYTGYDPDKPDYTKYPLGKYAKPVIAELKAGDMLYLPTSWFHLIKSGPGRSLAVNYWYQPISHSEVFHRMALKSAFWRDPNDPFAPLVAKRKIDAHTPEEEHAPIQAFTGAHPQDHPNDNTANAGTGAKQAEQIPTKEAPKQNKQESTAATEPAKKQDESHGNSEEDSQEESDEQNDD